jgi:HTH-type transcriptional regulator/antitoxin HigA
VRLVFVDAFPSAKIDGGSMYVDGYPVIGLSGRGKRLDKVLFTLLHEIGHILKRHVDEHHYIVEEIVETHDEQGVQESEADNLASDLLFQSAFPQVPARIGGPWVDQVANQLDVAPIVVVGHLQHKRRLDWRTTLAKNAPVVGDALETWA